MRLHARRTGWRSARLAGLVVLLGLAAGLAGCAFPRLVPGPGEARAGARCQPAFPYRDGWLGGDAAYSIPLGGGESIWLFGDSFVRAPGETERPDRRGAHFVHNSVARSRCDAKGRWSITYRWGQGREGPRAFLEPEGGEHWWWLFDGFVHRGALYIGLLRVESTPPRGPLGLPFAFAGVDLARVENPRDAFADWRIEIRPLGESREMLPTSALVVDGDHLHLFAFLDREAGAHPRVLTRLPLARLSERGGSLAPHLETLTRDGRWTPGLDPDAARIVMDDDATEMSVDRLPGGGWIAVYSYPRLAGDFPRSRPDDRVWVRTAQTLEGPWSAPRSLFRAPELDPDWAGGHDPHSACYAAKAHDELSAPGTLVFTYVCNLFAGPHGDPIALLLRLADDMDLYRPVPVSIPLPEDLLAPAVPEVLEVEPTLDIRPPS